MVRAGGRGTAGGGRPGTRTDGLRGSPAIPRLVLAPRSPGRQGWARPAYDVRMGRSPDSPVHFALGATPTFPGAALQQRSWPPEAAQPSITTPRVSLRAGAFPASLSGFTGKVREPWNACARVYPSSRPPRYSPPRVGRSPAVQSSTTTALITTGRNRTTPATAARSRRRARPAI